MNSNHITEYGSIVEKTVLLKLNFRRMGTSKGIPSNVINASVNSKLLKIQKTLFESPEFDAIVTADNQIRAEIKSLCLDYDMGLSLLPRVTVEHAYQLMKAYREDTRPELVNAFLTAYPMRKDIAKTKTQLLADEMGLSFDLLWKEKDYPSVDVVRGKFSFDWDILSLSVPDELKLSGKFEEEMEKQQIKIASVAEEITAVMRQTLLDLITHLKVSLEPNADGKPKRLFNTAVTNVQDFLDTFKARNITNDTELESLAGELQKVLHPGVYADVLKQDESLKDTVHSSMEEISAKLSALVEVTPGRKFRNVGEQPAPVESSPDDFPTPGELG